METEQIEYDESRWPLVVVHFPESFSHEDWMAQVRNLGASVDRAVRERVRYAIIVDAARVGSPPSALQRKAASDFNRDRYDDLKKHLVGWASVITSPILRGAITAMTWLQPTPFPQRVFGTIEAAEEWAQGQIAQSKPRALTS
jgi:hypothetical protein